MSAHQTTKSDAQGAFCFVQRCCHVIVSALGIESGDIDLHEVGDSSTVAIDCIGNNGEFRGNGGQIDR